LDRVPAILLFLTSSAFAAAAEVQMDPSDDFSPLLFLMALLAILVRLIVLGICLAVAVVTVVCLLTLVALGILSTAALTGIVCRKFSSGLRALPYQACAALAAYSSFEKSKWKKSRIEPRTSAIRACAALPLT
jgi:hypothetical protein